MGRNRVSNMARNHGFSHTLTRRSENSYARVTGNLKKFGNKRYINSTNIRSCTDPHELYFHLAEVLTVDLILTKGMVR